MEEYSSSVTLRMLFSEEQKKVLMQIFERNNEILKQMLKRNLETLTRTVADQSLSTSSANGDISVEIPAGVEKVVKNVNSAQYEIEKPVTIDDKISNNGCINKSVVSINNLPKLKFNTIICRRSNTRTFLCDSNVKIRSNKFIIYGSYEVSDIIKGFPILIFDPGGEV